MQKSLQASPAMAMVEEVCLRALRDVPHQAFLQLPNLR